MSVNCIVWPHFSTLLFFTVRQSSIDILNLFNLNKGFLGKHHLHLYARKVFTQMGTESHWWLFLERAEIHHKMHGTFLHRDIVDFLPFFQITQDGKRLLRNCFKSFFPVTINLCVHNIKASIYFFHNEEIFVKLDESVELDRIIHE